MKAMKNNNEKNINQLIKKVASFSNHVKLEGGGEVLDFPLVLL